MNKAQVNGNSTRTDLYSIATKDSSASNVVINIFSEEALNIALHMYIPKYADVQVVETKVETAYSSTDLIILDQGIGARGRKRGSNQIEVSQQPTKIRRKHSSISLEMREIERMRKAVEERESEIDVVEYVKEKKKAIVKPVAYFKPPKNLYGVITQVFEEFWELEIDKSISLPFFGMITQINCANLGMPDYFQKVESSVTLANIKVKMDSRAYTNQLEFSYDFRIMFDNAMTYYPVGSREYEKARELKDMFEDRWSSAESLFITR